jgi:curved DNA binding protein
MGLVSGLCVDGASITDICVQGDEAIVKETSAVYNKKVDGKAVDKGVAFPTCISVNNIICHNSPLKSDAVVALKTGDLVKVDLGVHIDGYIAVVANTLVVGASKENPIKGRQADAVIAAYKASEAALRLVKPGASSADVTKAIQKIAEDFKCLPIEGMLSHQIVRNKIDGEKVIIQNPNEQQRKEHKECTFEVNEVYSLDIIVSTGEAKPRQSEQRTTVYKKTDTVYLLKMKASRTLFSEVTKSFTTMPFTLRSCEDEVKARAGLKECVDHGVLQPYQVLLEREGEFVAQFKLTALLMPNGTVRCTGGSFDPSLFQSEFDVKDEELKKLLATSVGSKSKKKKKAGKKAGAAAGGKEEEEDGEEEGAAAAADA